MATPVQATARDHQECRQGLQPTQSLPALPVIMNAARVLPVRLAGSVSRFGEQCGLPASGFAEFGLLGSIFMGSVCQLLLPGDVLPPGPAAILRSAVSGNASRPHVYQAGYPCGPAKHAPANSPARNRRTGYNPASNVASNTARNPGEQPWRATGRATWRATRRATLASNRASDPGEQPGDQQATTTTAWQATPASDSGKPPGEPPGDPTPRPTLARRPSEPT